MGLQLKYVCKTGITTDEFINDITNLATGLATSILDLSGADQTNSVALGTWGDSPAFTLEDNTDIDVDNKRRVLSSRRTYDINLKNYIELKVDVNGAIFISPCEDYDFVNFIKINPVYYSDIKAVYGTVTDGTVFNISIHGNTIIINGCLVSNIDNGKDICDVYYLNSNITNGYYYWASYAKIHKNDGTDTTGSAASSITGIMDSTGYKYYNSSATYNTIYNFINQFIGTNLVDEQPLISHLYTSINNYFYIIKPNDITAITGITFIGIADQTVDDIYTTPDNEEYRVCHLLSTSQSVLFRTK